MQTLFFSEPVVVEGRFIRQYSSRDSYGHIFLTIEPCESKDLIFSWEISEQDVPKEYEAAVLHGIQGFLKKHELVCVNTHIRAIGGSYHHVDSSPLAYTIATGYALDDAIKRAGVISNA